MKISIPDDLHDRITAVHGAKTQAAILRALDSLPLQEKGRTLVLDALQIAELEALLAGGSLLHGGDLVRKVQALADFKVGEVRVEFDASDYNRLQQRATRIGLSVPDYLRLMLDRFRQEWMDIGEPVVLETPEQEAARMAAARKAKEAVGARV